MSEVRGVSVDLRIDAPAPVRGAQGHLAAAALAGAAALLWVWPPLGLVVAVVTGWTLAPWGRRLGERLLVSAVVTAGSVAVLLAAASVARVSPPPEVWRLAVAAALLAIAALRLRDSRARCGPALPRVGWDDAIALATGAVLAGALALPHLLVPLSRSLTGLYEGWDHSSHLVMFAQTMRAGGWDVSSLGGDVMFAVYPMLHTGLWSVGEWVAGVSGPVSGIGLVRSYVLWSSLTAGLAAVLAVASASTAARALAGANRWRSMGPVVAAGITASWFLLGTPALMADFAFSNFLLATTLTGAAVVVGTRSPRAMATLGPLVLPLGVVAVAYLYPPLAGGVVAAAVVALVVLWRQAPRSAIAMIGLGVVCAVATLPAVRIVIEPFAGRAVGEIKGGIPPSELVVGMALGAVVVVSLLRGLSDRPLGARVALATPLALTSAVAVVFALQAVALGVPVHESYYAKKVVYAVLLLSIPLAAALVARWAPGWTVARSPLRAGTAVVTGCALALAAASVVTAGPRPNTETSAASPLPPGIWSLAQRVDSITRDDVEGRALLVAARTRPGWVAVTVMDDHDVQAGRTAAGLAGTLTWRDNQVIELAHDNLEALATRMARDPELRVRFVVTDPARAQALAPLERRFGPDRVQVELVGR